MHVGDVGTRKPRGENDEFVREAEGSEVELEYVLEAGNVWAVDANMPIELARVHENGVQYVRPVGTGEDDAARRSG
jgi:hypothetical protein